MAESKQITIKMTRAEAMAIMRVVGHGNLSPQVDNADAMAATAVINRIAQWMRPELAAEWFR